MVQKTKNIRKHSGIHQTGGKAGKLKKGYKYSGKKLKNGKAQIVKGGATRWKLATVAGSAQNVSKLSAAKIIICHKAVLYWIKEAGYITEKMRIQIEKNIQADAWDKVLVSRDDNIVQDWVDVPVGAIIGFFYESPNMTLLQHSMIVVEQKSGQTALAGVNNLNVLKIEDAVKHGVFYAKVNAQTQIKNDKLRRTGMIVRWATAETIVNRLLASCPLLFK